MMDTTGKCHNLRWSFIKSTDDTDSFQLSVLFCAIIMVYDNTVIHAQYHFTELL